MLVWNIEGIKSKLWDSDFISYLKTFDVFGLIETWDQNSDEDVKKPFLDYCSFSCAATKVAKHGRAIGGISVFIKSIYKSFFTRIELDCTFAIFLKCDRSFLNLDKHLIFSFVYLPPNGSTFYQDKYLSGIFIYLYLYMTICIIILYLETLIVEQVLLMILNCLKTRLTV